MHLKYIVINHFSHFHILSNEGELYNSDRAVNFSFLQMVHLCLVGAEPASPCIQLRVWASSHLPPFQVCIGMPVSTAAIHVQSQEYSEYSLFLAGACI